MSASFSSKNENIRSVRYRYNRFDPLYPVAKRLNKIQPAGQGTLDFVAL